MIAHTIQGHGVKRMDVVPEDINTLSAIIRFTKSCRNLQHGSNTNLVIYDKRNLSFNTYLH
jgi:hypothetical protein